MTWKSWRKGVWNLRTTTPFACETESLSDDSNCAIVSLVAFNGHSRRALSIERRIACLAVDSRELFTLPYWGWYTSYWHKCTPPNYASPLGVCVLFQWCIRTQRRILGISLLGDPEILSVLVCLTSVCIRILKTVFYCSEILSVISRFTSIAYVSCKCSPKCIIQVLYRYTGIRPEILYPNLSVTPPKKQKSWKIYWQTLRSRATGTSVLFSVQEETIWSNKNARKPSGGRAPGGWGSLHSSNFLQPNPRSWPFSSCKLWLFRLHSSFPPSSVLDWPVENASGELHYTYAFKPVAEEVKYFRPFTVVQLVIAKVRMYPRLKWDLYASAEDLIYRYRIDLLFSER